MSTFIKNLEQGILDNQIQSKNEQNKTSSVSFEKLHHLMTYYLQKKLGDIIVMDPNTISIKDSFDMLGVDSVVIMNLNEELEESFPNLSKTLFYEHNNLEEVARFLVEEYPDEVMVVFQNMSGQAYETDVTSTAKGVDTLPDLASRFMPVIISDNREQVSEEEPAHSAFLAQETPLEEVGELTEPEGIIAESKAQFIHTEQFETDIGSHASNDSEPPKHNPSEITTPTEEKRMNGQKRKVDPIHLENTNLLDNNKGFAIVGISGRFPQAENLDEFWENIAHGIDCVTEIPEDRWDHRKYFSSKKGVHGKVYSKWGGFLDNYNSFDPFFFQMTPKDAQLLDPQERIFLQCANGAIEDAGYSKKKLWGTDTGVFVGVINGHYQMYGAQETAFGKLQSLSSSFSSIANRVSYYHNFTGPSVAVDTMCSSSLTALHMACQSIESGDCTAAVVGGVNLILHPDKYIYLCNQYFASSEGKCRAFGTGGDGYVPGEGVGVLLIKSYDDAIKDNDYIYGLVSASAINHGGKTNGYTVPSPISQASVVNTALKNARITPRLITYVEAHGTGTELGDPIEVNGLTKAYREYTNNTQYCAIGSVKANIGHLEAAAGVVSIIKVLLQMKYKQLAPSILSKELNPNIDFNKTPFYVQHELTDWERPTALIDGEEVELDRYSAISSFGAGGSNIHVILKEYKNQVAEEKESYTDPRIFILSAANKERLIEYCSKYIKFITKCTQSSQIGQGRVSRKQHHMNGTDILLSSIKEIVRHQEDILISERLEELGMTYADCQTLYNKLREYNLSLPHYLFRPDIQIAELASIIHIQLAKNNSADALITNGDRSSMRLEDLVYTSQMGRDHMKERLAIPVRSLSELLDKLTQFVETNNDLGIYYGNSKKESSVIEIFSEEADTIMQTLLNQKKYDRISELWAKGVDIPWDMIAKQYDGRKIPIPTYPFEKKDYWYSDAKPMTAPLNNIITPVIDRNVSTLEQQRYTKRLTQADFYIHDHIINMQHILPGVAYLEMFYQIASLATQSSYVSYLKDVQWKIPILMDMDYKDVILNLELIDDETAEAQAITLSDDGTEIIHASCTICYADIPRQENVTALPFEYSDVHNKSQMKYTKEECYKKSFDVNINYLDGFQVIEELAVIDQAVVSRLQLPDYLEESLGSYVLQPSLCDGCMQTVLMYLNTMSVNAETYVARGVGQVVIHKALTPKSYCLVEKIDTGNAENIFNMFLLDKDMQPAITFIRLEGAAIPQRTNTEQ